MAAILPIGGSVRDSGLGILGRLLRRSGVGRPELAKDHVRALFDYQTEEGMIPDFVSRIKYINNLRDTKPPLASWAVEEIYDADGDFVLCRGDV